MIAVTLIGSILVSALNGQPHRGQPMVEADLIAAVDAECTRQVADDRFSGAVAIARAGQPVFARAYGLADREQKIANTVETKFGFGSMGKMFTGVAVLQLVQAGKLQLQDTVAAHLRGCPNADVAAVTIEQLLTHTGGTGDIFSPEYEARRLELKQLSDYVALYQNRGVRFPPGSRWEYSNYGMILLGRIIEVVSGQSYADFVREHIFRPAGMTSTDNLPADEVEGLAIGYTAEAAGGSGPRLRRSEPGRAQGPLRSTQGEHPYRGTSAGGGYGAVVDFVKFAHALSNGTLLNAEFSSRATTGQVVTPRPGTKYAYGFEEEIARDGRRSFGHGGGAPGTNGRLIVYPKSGYVVVVLANMDPPAADDLARFIAERLPRE